MKINYVLHPNLITSEPDAHRAIIVNRTTYSVEDVVKQITGEGSILKETECNAVIDSFFKRIGQNLAEGICFHSDYFSVGIEISGVFVSDKDKFDAERHLIYPNLNPGKPWKELLSNVKPEKVTAEENKPRPEMLIDLKSKTNNQVLSPGGMAELQGALLKVDETMQDEGIFILSTNGGGETRVSYLYMNFPKSIQFEIPETLAKGSYKIEVRNRAHSAKNLRTGVLGFTLNVA
ncbi:MAG: DNA-binding domain-containing protein [Bacteroidales bacterium]